MTLKYLSLCAAWLVVTALLGGCSSTVPYYPVNSARSVYVKNLPPPPKSETRSARPSEVHVWIGGSWHWQQTDATWIWKKGSWKKPPKKGYEWKDSACEKRRDRVIVYTPGHWVYKQKMNKTAAVAGANVTTDKEKPAKKTDPAKPAEPEKAEKIEPAKPAEPGEPKQNSVAK
jgi:hypothetical protein